MNHKTLGTMNVVGQALNMTATPQPDTLRMATPELGEHTDDILSELGYDDDKIKSLHGSEIV